MGKRMRLLVVDEEIIAGGVETLRRELLPELAARVEKLIWVLPDHMIGQFKVMAEACPNLRMEGLAAPRGTRAQLDGALSRRLARFTFAQRRLVRLRTERVRDIARRHGCEVYFTTCVFGQGFPEIDLPVAGMVSDLNPDLPETIRENILRWVEKAEVTLAISEFTKAELVRLKPRSAERVQVAPLAAPGQAEVTARNNGSGPVTFYYPATPNRHKGHLALLEAARLLAVRGLDFQLVCSGAGLNSFFAGAENPHPVSREMWRFLEEHKTLLEKRVRVEGEVDSAEVARLFSTTGCVVLPSSYEGFGLPLAEALRFGKPVICSDIPPFREQVRRYGCEDIVTLTQAGKAEALAEAMAEQIARPKEVSNLTPSLNERLARWTWGDAAQACVDHLSGVLR